MIVFSLNGDKDAKKVVLLFRKALHQIFCESTLVIVRYLGNLSLPVLGKSIVRLPPCASKLNALYCTVFGLLLRVPRHPPPPPPGSPLVVYTRAGIPGIPSGTSNSCTSSTLQLTTALLLSSPAAAPAPTVPSTPLRLARDWLHDLPGVAVSTTVVVVAGVEMVMGVGRVRVRGGGMPLEKTPETTMLGGCTGS